MINTACEISSALTADGMIIPGSLTAGNITLEGEFNASAGDQLPSELSVRDNIIQGGLSPGDILLEGQLDVNPDGRLPNYTGDYTAIPKTYEQTLATKNKSMTGDVVIEEIPYSEVSNPSGGNTVNIAYIP